jgi:hypothetical protein
LNFNNNQNFSKNSIKKLDIFLKLLHFKGKKLKIECANDIIKEMREKSLINIKKELPKNNEKIVEKFIETN